MSSSGARYRCPKCRASVSLTGDDGASKILLENPLCCGEDCGGIEMWLEEAVDVVDEPEGEP